MGDGQEQDHHEERLKEVFNSFDANGCGTLSPEELSELCQSLHLDDATPAVLHALLQNQDQVNARVDFEQFKNALILVLSAAAEPPEERQSLPEQESPEIQPKYVKGTKRYGRRSTPEFLEPLPDLPDVAGRTSAAEEDFEDNCDSAVPRKRERWNGYKTGSEEYEAEGQMHLWNPDEPSTPRGSIVPLSARLEESLREACEELSIMWDGCAGHNELLTLCEHVGLEINEDVLLGLTGDGAVNVQDFVSRVVNHNKSPTPSASTPYRQLKRLHSMQPFDEGGRRIVTPSALTCSIGTRLFSTLDDGSGFIPAEYILDAWIEEGIENSAEILQTLNFDLDGKLSLGELTMALENELLVTKNGVHQAALASFKAEIRYLLERVDREIREKEKIQSDLEKAEKLKMQFASEVDEHHSAIEHMNNLNLRKLEQEHKEKMAAVRSELMMEIDQIQQQAGLQREELETEIQKIREDESFLREHLSISVKENRRLEMELLDSSEKLVEAQSQISKLQTNLDNIMKDKFGDLDPNSADFLLQEDRIKQLRSGYEAQFRELQDRIDELQSELQEFHNLGRAHQSCQKPLSEELESKSPGMESDPGIGSEEVQPFSMSLEAEMMLEQLKEQHLHDMEDLRNQLENKIAEFEKMVEKQRLAHEDHNATLSLQHQQEIQALQEQMASVQTHAQKLQSQLDQTEQEQRQQVAEREELDSLQEEEVRNLRQQLLQAHNSAADLEKQLKALEMQQAETAEDLHTEMEDLREKHAAEVSNLKDGHAELLKARLAEQRKELQDERVSLEQSLLDGWEKERKLLHESHEEKIEELRLKFEEERNEVVKNLMEQWQREKAQLDEQNSESLQVLLEEEMLRLLRDQEDQQSRLTEQWDQERAQLQEQQEKGLIERLQEERLHFEQRERKLREEWETERLQLEEDFEGMIQERLIEEKEKLKTEREEEERRVEKLMAEEKDRLEQRHREAMKELRAIHAEERDALSATLDKLRDDITQERSEASRLAEKNIVLKQKIAALKVEDLKEIQQLTQTVEHLNKEKFGTQKATETFHKQLSELRLQNQQLHDANRILLEKNAQNTSDMESLRQQLHELTEERREAFPAEERNKLADCVSALEAELTKALEDTAKLEERNIQLSQKLSESRGKVKLTDESLQCVNRQSARLKTDLRIVQQEKDSFKREVTVLHKQLQNTKDKNIVLEKALHSSGLQSQSKRLYREEMSHVMEQEQQLLRQENDRLQAEVRSVKDDLIQTQEKARQLDATILSLKQHKQQSNSSLVKMLEQENITLKQELEAQREQNKSCEAGQRQTELESLQQENEALKAQMARLSTQLIETFQAQLVGLLPPSPHGIPRGQHHAEDPDNMQGPMPEQRATHADSYRRIGGL